MGLTTIPEFLEQRYDSGLRKLITLLLLLGYLLTYLPTVLYSGALVFNQIFNISTYKIGLCVSLPKPAAFQHSRPHNRHLFRQSHFHMDRFSIDIRIQRGLIAIQCVIDLRPRNSGGQLQIKGFCLKCVLF